MSEPTYIDDRKQPDADVPGPVLHGVFTRHNDVAKTGAAMVLAAAISCTAADAHSFEAKAQAATDDVVQVASVQAGGSSTKVAIASYTSADALSPWGKELLRFKLRASELRQLPKGWKVDREGDRVGRKIQKRNLRRVEALVAAMKCWPPFLYALEDGGVAVEWDAKDRMLRLEFRGNDYRILAFPAGNIAGGTNPPSAEALAHLIDELLTAAKG